MTVIMKAIIVSISGNTKTPEAKTLFHLDADLPKYPLTVC
jgi:hypothetical protein